MFGKITFGIVLFGNSSWCQHNTITLHNNIKATLKATTLTLMPVVYANRVFKRIFAS
jgi:hypothetical protein